MSKNRRGDERGKGKGRYDSNSLSDAQPRRQERQKEHFFNDQTENSGKDEDQPGIDLTAGKRYRAESCVGEGGGRPSSWQLKMPRDGPSPTMLLRTFPMERG